jgi:hypothetical protein
VTAGSAAECLGYPSPMPDLGDIEKEASSHSSQVDDGINKADQEIDKDDGGRDQGMVDEAAQEAEKDIGGQQGNGQPPGQ